MKELPIGKIDMTLLNGLIHAYTAQNNRVVVGSGIGEDAAVIDMGSHYLIAKTDPITHAAGEIGHYAVNINANDIAAMGGIPLWFLATILLPPGSTAEDLERIFAQISKSCTALGIIYCGGHTEVTTSVTSPVVIGQMLGETAKSNLKPSSGARPGDDLIMTKSAAIEATSIIAIERAHVLKTFFSDETIETAREYLYTPGISVLKEARIVSQNPGVHALHDPTEGGISTGIFEMAQASGTGVEVFFEAIPISEVTGALCAFCDIDPLGAFASGSLLIAADPGTSDNIIDDLALEGIAAARIGLIHEKEKGMLLHRGGTTMKLAVFDQDELSRIFG